MSFAVWQVKDRHRGEECRTQNYFSQNVSKIVFVLTTRIVHVCTYALMRNDVIVDISDIAHIRMNIAYLFNSIV